MTNNTNEDLQIIPSELFHLNSKQTRSNFQFYDQVLRVQTDPEIKKVITSAYKKYPPSKKIPLSNKFPATRKNFEEIILTRHSVREFHPGSIPLNAVSKILHFSNGITGKNTDADGILHYFRASPSAGGLYPIEIYLAAMNVEKLDSGIYHYSPLANNLELISDDDPSKKFSEVTFNQAPNTSAVIILSGIPGKSKFKYGERGYRFMMMEAGHIAQNILLATNSLNLASFPMGGFIDNEIDDFIQIDGINEISLYMVLIGRKRGKTAQQPKVKTSNLN